MAGRITAIHGPMFSGKTEELLRIVRRARIARKKCQVFKPTKDDRYHAQLILPHHLVQQKILNTDLEYPFGEKAQTAETAQKIFRLVDDDTDMVAIEEAQFFDYELFYVLKALSNRGIDIVIALLDQDFRRMPFRIGNTAHNVGDYLAIAHESLKLTAICMQCGYPAQYSQKLVLNASFEKDKDQAEYVSASFEDEIVAVGTSIDMSKQKKPAQIYEARCLGCHEIRDEPDYDRALRAKKNQLKLSG